ncbi:MFS-type transporter 1 [Paramyrothecium foliicola]|nr:MFS-type transporter 1 [Paramyrothecium foliicola]
MATQTETIVIAPQTTAEHGPVSSVPLEVLEKTLSTRSRVLQDEKTEIYSRFQKLAIVTQLSGVNFCSSAINGLVVVGLPVMAADLQLPESLAFWPSSVGNLGTAAALLLAGSIADAFGARAVDLAGSFTLSAFMLGAAWSKTGSQLVAMRAIQGVGVALHFSSSIALVTQAMPRGRGRNIAFAVLGLSQPLGFSFGLVIGGILIDASGWRTGWYIYGSIALFLSIVGLWALPRNPENLTLKQRLIRVRTKIDWIGALLITAFMTMLCYLLAVISSDTSKIRERGTIVLLCLSAVTLPSFIAWMHYRVSKGKPALIPNSLWRNPAFATICGITALSFSGVNAMELFSNLFFQEVQHLSALESSLRIVPSLVVGVLLGLTIGFFVDRFRAIWLVGISSALCAGSPLLMAVIEPHWSYWAGAFEAQLLCPISANVLFTVGLIVISEVFPEDTQALAGAVFNTSAQFGTALGLAILQTISSSVTKNHDWMGETRALLEGYRASFWALFGFAILCVVLSALGLRRAGKVGLKKD